LTAIVDSSLFLTETSLWYDWKEKKIYQTELENEFKKWERKTEKGRERERETGKEGWVSKM